MDHPLDAALDDPWRTLRLVLGDPLHPGGDEVTIALLDRADVAPGTTLLDVGCGAGNALSLASERGARAVGIDRRPEGPRAIGADLDHLPVRDSRVDIVLAECALCLSSDLDRSLAEAARVLRPSGRLAVSDVVRTGVELGIPDPVADALCLSSAHDRATLLEKVEAAGFAVESVRGHRADLLAMRDRARRRLDYRRLLRAFGDRGRELLEAVDELEEAIENGDVGYVSVVARVVD